MKDIKILVLAILLCMAVSALSPQESCAQIPAQERAALIDLYNGTNGPGWTIKTGWLGAAGTECSWHGISCNESQKSVQSINLWGNRLSGELPSSLGNLGNLQWLWLVSNQLSGAIPSSLGNLGNLTTLNLMGNRLSGEIPSSLGNLSKLTSLLLSENQLSGNIPYSLGNLPNLVLLYLSENKLSGSIPSSLGSLSNLQLLYLSNNQLNGTIPAELGNLNSLQDLLLFNNLLSGGIPSSLGNLGNLKLLRLDSNQLSGAIPAELGNLSNLRDLYLSENQLSGSIPSSLGNLNNLKLLYLYSTQVSGSIPSSLGNLPNLESLYLSDSQLSGTIPAELGNLSSLGQLILANNQLSGSIPASLGNLGNLVYLVLSSNQLSGEIPSSLGNLGNLIGLNLSGNWLSGRIPPALGGLSNLTSLDLSGNQLSGDLPAELGNLSKLGDLYLNSNQLSGSIPSSLGDSNLGFINLNSNQLSGSIPPKLGNLSRLWALRLDGNQLSGSIPAELGNLRNLQDLSISSNRLSGSIPSSLGNLTNLYSLDISYNALYSADPALTIFLSSKQSDWQNTQTVAPSAPSAVASSSKSIFVSWSPILYTWDSGRYEVYRSTTSSGPYVLAGSTANKWSASLTVADLAPATTYYFVIRTVTDPNASNKNLVASEYSTDVSAATNASGPTTAKITVTTSATGLSFSVGGSTYTTSQTFTWIAGSSHTISTTSPQGSGGTRYVFTNWSDGGAISHGIIVPANATSYTANFKTQYLLTKDASPASGGTINASPTSVDGFHDSGTAVRLAAAANGSYVFSSWSGALTGPTNPQTITMSIPRSVTATFLRNNGLGYTLDLDAGGAAIVSTGGVEDTIRTGYAKLTSDSGVIPYATAVLIFKQDGVTVSEAGIPASSPTTRARVFIDYRAAVSAVPGHSEAGTIEVNTGIAIVNYGSATANVTYTLNNASGNSIAIGHEAISPGKHFACFIDHLKDEAAPDFNLPPDFQTAIQFGSLEIVSTQPLSVLALRGTVNQRNEFLITTTPVADLTQTPANGSMYFPQFADGGGYTTSLILLNTSNVMETGRMEIKDKDGNPLTISQVGGTRDSSFNYSVEPGGLFRFQSDGFPLGTSAGWVRLTPDAGTPTPVGSGVFGYSPNGILASESGIPAANATTHARIYVDLSGNHNTGLAIANISGIGSSITINAFQNDGITTVGASKPPIPLPANGYTAGFADEFVTGLPAGFTGVLDISSTVPFAALTLRSLDNERGDFLMTTFPVADINQPASSPIVFPQIADGGGYRTEFILLGTGGASSTMISLYDDDGKPLSIISGTTDAAPGFEEQPSYTGNCAARPAGSGCLQYDDGYVWLVYDSISGWENIGSWQGKQIWVGYGFKADYYHILGTLLIKQVRNDTILFANFESTDVPVPSKGGWRVGGGAQSGNAGTMIGLLVTPAKASTLSRIEIVVSPERGSTLNGYLMNDNDGPGALIETLSFTVPSAPPGQAVVVSAASSVRPTLDAAKRYWFILAPPDLVNSSFFWWRHANQPAATIAYRIGTSGPFQIYTAYGAMLRIYGE